MINIYKLKLTSLQQEILRLLFIRTGKQLNQNNIAKALNVSPAAVMKALPKIRDGNLINMSQDKESKRWAIELNTDNHRVMQIKRAENLKMIYESGLADFLEKELPGSTIILFGSYSRGEDTIRSDIDIAVIGRKEKHINLDDFEKKLERNISINFYASFKEIHKNLKENLFNGIVLFGGVEL
ncbi:nucleotidyltransferase domain-containing protein [Candidatus Woesearchaeota archaeon]|nr:nucleotidyltransferase domain-containing protein [Candidatus Woesearchaeota archaeon]